MARILIITLVFAPDGVSTSTLVSQLAADLQTKGHSLSVLTTVPHYNFDAEAHAQQPLIPHWQGWYSRSSYQGIPVWHTWVTEKGQNTRSRLLEYLLFNLISLLLGLFAVGKQDIILVVSPPLTSGIIGWILAKTKRAKLIYNIQERYPEAFIQSGMIAANSRLARLLNWMETFVYRKSDYLVPICQAFADSVRAQNIPPDKIRLIPNFVDIEAIHPIPKDNSLAQELGLVEAFVVLYAGNIGMTQSFDSLLEAAAHLQTESNIHFLIVGDGVRRDWLTQQIQTLPNVSLLAYQPQSRVLEIYGTGDLGLVPLKKGAAQATLPSKLYSIMASGKPTLVVVDDDSDIVQTVNAAQCGFVIPPDDSAALVEAIQQAYHQRDHLKQLGENARRYAESHFSRHAVTNQYHEFFQQL